MTPSPTMAPSIFRSGSGPKFWSTASKYDKRQEKDDDNKPRNSYPDYPLLVKIEEIRKPSDNIESYCEQMQVLDNGLFNVVGGVARIPVLEFDTVDSVAEKRLSRRREDDPELSQNCVCEWMTGERY